MTATLPPWQPPESISPLVWYGLWAALALLGLYLFQRFHPLRPEIRRAANFMRENTSLWLILALVGVAASLIQLTPLGLQGGGVAGAAAHEPKAATVGAALAGGIHTAARLFYFPVEAWPFSLLAGIACLIGWRGGTRRLWTVRREPAPIWGNLAFALVVGGAAMHLLYRIDPMTGWLPDDGALRWVARPLSRLFELVVAFSFQVYLFVAIAQRLDRAPKALLIDRIERVFSRLLRVVPLALLFLVIEGWLDLLGERLPGAGQLIGGWIVPEILIILCPLTYIMVFSRSYPSFFLACSAALHATWESRWRVLWFLLFGLTLCTLLHFVSAHMAIAAEGIWLHVWTLFEPFLKTAIVCWLLATWFIVLQGGMLAVLSKPEPVKRGAGA